MNEILGSCKKIFHPKKFKDDNSNIRKLLRT